MLVNELCEVTIHPETGGIRGIRDLHARGNRLSQQVAMRLRRAVPMPVGLGRDPDEDAIYSQMVADSIEITANSSIAGEITSRGRLLDSAGRELARFIQRSRLAAARAWLELDIELVPREAPHGDPWDRYFACRFAWAEEFSEIRRSVHEAAVVTELKRIEAPDFIEVVGTKTRTAILCGGLAYHQRIGPRMLDTFLVVQGETERRFRLAIALEQSHPWQAAAEFECGSMLVNGRFQPPSASNSGWLFHLDTKNVQTTHWSPLVENDAVVGFRVRLLELGGRGTRVTLRTFRDVAAARRLTLVGDGTEELSADGNRIQFEIGGHEWLELEARWSE
jgi:alpha-mannosidase